MSGPRIPGMDRKRGTGKVSFRRGRWVARGPEVNGRSTANLGTYDTRQEAEAAVATFLAEQRRIA